MKNTEILHRSFTLLHVKQAAAEAPITINAAPVTGASVLSQLLSMLAAPAVTGGVRSLMTTDADVEKKRGRGERFARGAAYGALVPLGAQLGGVGGGVVGGLAGGATGLAAGTLASKGDPAAGLAGALPGGFIGGGAGALAGAGAGGYATYKLLKKLLGD
jgi:hypothetical protein